MLRLVLAALALLTLAGCSDAHGAHTTLVIDFPDGRADVEAEVKGLTSTGGNYTAHDQILAWSADSGTAIDVKRFSFGSCLNRIDGVPEVGSCEAGATAYWALSVNGVPSETGMDDVVLADHDVVTWTYTPLDP